MSVETKAFGFSGSRGSSELLGFLGFTVQSLAFRYLGFRVWLRVKVMCVRLRGIWHDRFLARECTG